MTTVSNVQNLLGAHEFIGHYEKGWGSSTGTHYKVYEYQMKHASWKKTTPYFQQYMFELYQDYLKKER